MIYVQIWNFVWNGQLCFLDYSCSVPLLNSRIEDVNSISNLLLSELYLNDIR